MGSRKELDFRVGQLGAHIVCSTTSSYELFRSVAAHVVLPSYDQTKISSPDLWISETSARKARYSYVDKTLRFSLDANSDPMDPLFYCIGPIDRLNQELHNTVMIHSSAVRLNGRAFIFQGESGNGKTLLAFYLRRLGHSILSTDHSLIQATDNGLCCIGGSRAWRIKPGAIAGAFPEIKTDYPSIDFSSYKPTILSIEDPWRTSVLLGGVYLLRVTDGPLEVSRLKEIDYVVPTFRDASKYIRGTFPLDLNTPAPSLDTQRLAKWRLDLVRELGQNAKAVRGNLAALVEFLQEEARR